MGTVITIITLLLFDNAIGTSLFGDIQRANSCILHEHINSGVMLHNELTWGSWKRG